MAFLTSTTLLCLESAAEQLVLELGCGNREIWLGRVDWTEEHVSGGLGTFQDEHEPLLFLLCCSQQPGWLQQVGTVGEKWQVWEEECMVLVLSLLSSVLTFSSVWESWEKNSAEVPGTGLLREEYSNKREENTWEWVLAAHLSQCDPKQKALALTQNDLFPCCQNVHFCVCYLLLHGSFKAEMIDNSLPWYMIAGAVGCLVGLTHHKRRCLGKYCLFLVWINTRADHFVNWCALMREEGAVCYFTVILEYLLLQIVLLLWDSGPYSANNPEILNS